MNQSTASSSEDHPIHDYQIHVVEDMVAGFGAGFLAVSLGFPLDVIKTRIQTNSCRTNQKEGAKPTATSKGIFKTGRSIVRKEGVMGLYKGIASPLLTLSVSSSLLFTSYGTCRDFFNAQQGWHSGNFWAGIACGPINGPISTAENHIRTQMQIDNVKGKRFRNSLHCISTIVRHHGFPTLFRGWDITLLRDCAYLSTYFYIYEGVKRTLQLQIMHQEEDSNNLLRVVPPAAAAIPIAGGAAGTIAWLVAYPLDCIRAGLQGQCLLKNDGGSHPSPSSLQVLRNLLRSRGIQGLFMGVTATLVRAPFVHGCRFSAYEGFLWLFKALRTEEGQQWRPTTTHPPALPPVLLKTR